MQYFASLMGLLATVSLDVNGYHDPVFALWPQHTDTTLSLSTVDDLTIVKASYGEALGTFNMKVKTESKIVVDPLLDTFEIVWIPTFDVRSSTFDRFWANSQRFDGMSAEGIRLQAKLRGKGSWQSINEADQERVEKNIRSILQAVLPSIGILPELSQGYLAKSMCDFRSWTTHNPAQEGLLHEHMDEPQSLCYSSSFRISPRNDNTTFLNKIIREAIGDSIDLLPSATERAVLETKRSLYTGQREHRLATVKFSRSPASAAIIEVEYLEVWASQTSTAKAPWRAAISTRETKGDILVVTLMTRDLGLDTFEYSWIRQGDMPLVSQSVFEIQMPSVAVAASVDAAIVGEGFHRRYVMDVQLFENEICDKTSSNKTLLMRVPVSKTVYLDLDEIRRTEHFDDLALISYTKHIKNQRPSSVSSQHVVGLKFRVPSTNKAHINFPLHFRYQAPSRNDLYRQASVIAPDLFIVCPNEDRLVKRTLSPSIDDAVQDYFEVSNNCVIALTLLHVATDCMKCVLQTWGLLDLSSPVSGDYHWLCLSTTSPVRVINVSVPVGYLSTWLVSSVTLLFASMGAALLLRLSVDAAKNISIGAGTCWKEKAE